MTGLLAIYAFDELWVLSTYVKYGLMALQHRGAESYVACTADDNIKCYSSSNIDDVAEHITTNKVIAATYSNGNEALYQEKVGNIGIAVLAERPHELLNEVAKDLAKGLSTGAKGVINSISNLRSIYDLPSFVALSCNGDIVVVRSSSGLTPMVLGGYGFDMAIASSESTAVDVLGADIRRFIGPGEIIYMSRHLIKKFNANPNGKSMLCLFEMLYLARHDAVIDGVSVYEFRKRLGAELAETFDRNVDVVVGVPETAIPYAIGFSNAIGRPFELAFIATGGRTRSMLRLDPREKLIAIHLKMNPIRSSLEGKRVALIDDSMVTGSTIKTVSQILRYRVGVEELHLLIASPPLVKTCPYNVMKLDMDKLLAANLSKEMAIKYLEVDSLSWLSPESVEKVAGSCRLRLCGRCFGVGVFGEGV